MKINLIAYLVRGQQRGSVTIFGDGFLTLSRDSRRYGDEISLLIPRVRLSKIFYCTSKFTGLFFRQKRQKKSNMVTESLCNSFTRCSVEDMCNIVSDIHAVVTNNRMKLILCNITPSYEEHTLQRKIELFNRNVALRLGGYDNVTICRGSSARRNSASYHNNNCNNKNNKNNNNNNINNKGNI